MNVCRIPLDRRVAAAQATLDEFRKRPFRLGRDDCVSMALFHLRRLGLSVKGLRPGKYRTVAQAKAQLKKMGATTIGDLLDKRFEQIPPAMAIVGDLLELDGERGMTAIHVALGNGRTAAYHQDIPDGTADVLQPKAIISAWRID